MTAEDRRGEIVARFSADEDHDVVTVKGGRSGYRRRPCGGCPWVVDNTGDFPPKAFERSAPTSYDAAMEAFACHEAGSENVKVCAGFLLRGAEHNIAIRFAMANGRIDPEQLQEGDRELFDSYRDMAVANGVDPESEALGPCRP